MPTGLGDDFDAALHQPSLLPVGFKFIEGYIGEHATDVFDRLNDVHEARDDRTRRH